MSIFLSVSVDKADDELEMTTVCHRPEGLDQLEAQTNFTKQELQILYRGFKNVIKHFLILLLDYVGTCRAYIPDTSSIKDLGHPNTNIYFLIYPYPAMLC